MPQKTERLRKRGRAAAKKSPVRGIFFRMLRKRPSVKHAKKSHDAAEPWRKAMIFRYAAEAESLLFTGYLNQPFLKKNSSSDTVMKNMIPSTAK